MLQWENEPNLGASGKQFIFKPRQFTNSPMLLVQFSSIFNDYFTWIWVICDGFPMDRVRYCIFWLRWLHRYKPSKKHTTPMYYLTPKWKLCSKTSFPPRGPKEIPEKNSTCFVGSCYSQQFFPGEFLNFSSQPKAPAKASSEVSNGIAAELLLNHRASRP